MNSADLSATRQWILTTAVADQPHLAGLLFEPDALGDGPYRLTARTTNATQTGRIEFSSDSPLVSWLRVNDAILSVPDSSGVFAELPLSDQQTLLELRVQACVPLVYEDELTGWLALVGDSKTTHVVEHSRELLRHTHSWASNLRAARDDESARRRNESVRRSNRLTVAGQLAAGVAHEVRNPLAIIRSIVQRIREGDAPAEDHDRLHRTVILEIDRVNAVLSNMLLLGRSREYKQGICDLTEIAEQASDFCRAYATRHQQQLICAGPAPIWAVGDARELRQVLVNILLNACQASTTGDTVRIDSSKDTESNGRSWAMVQVSDTGSGIPEELVDQVFEPFVTTKQDGGGLGLAICRDIIEHQGGHIEISSQVRHGTVVTIRLPWKDGR